MTSDNEQLTDDLNEETIIRRLSASDLVRNIVFYPNVQSTMDEARRFALSDAPEGTLVVADEQTSGRGRFNRSWISPPGANIYLSLLLRPRPNIVPQLTMVASLSLTKAIRYFFQVPGDIGIKWPNDVRILGRKVGGILIENSLGGDMSDTFSVIGMGVNVNFDPQRYPEISDGATSMQNSLGYTISRLDLLEKLIESINQFYKELNNGKNLVHEWADNSDTLGNNVRLTWGHQVFEGLAISLNEDGSLVLQSADGSISAFPSGEVSLTLE